MTVETQIGCGGRTFSSSDLREPLLAALASSQHGVVARRQLLEYGFSRDQIARMRASHRLHDVHRGVYAVGHRALTVRARWMAAVLACGPGALLSHRSCAALTGLRRTSLTYVEVTVPCRRGQIEGVRSHLNARVTEQDRSVIDGIPCTSVALTLLDLASILPRRGLERACDEAEVQEVFDLAAIEDVLERSRGCRGTAKLRAVLHEHAIGTTLTRPGLEERALALIDHHAIARPVVNARVVCRPGIAPEVDFLWRRERLVLVTDGGHFHSTRRQIERDRHREAELVRAGYRVLRATWRQVEHEPREVALMLRAALAGSSEHQQRVEADAEDREGRDPQGLDAVAGGVLRDREDRAGQRQGDGDDVGEDPAQEVQWAREVGHARKGRR